MQYEMVLSTKARKNLKSLSHEYRTRVDRALRKLAENPDEYPGVVAMKNEESFRIRVGDVRIVYTLEDQELIIEIIKIGFRGQVYRG